MSVTSPYTVCLELLLFGFVTVAHAAFFRGGLVRVKTVEPINRTAGLTIDITQRYSWRRSRGHITYCDSSTIRSRQIVANVGYMICRVGCTGIKLNVGIRCTDYSIADDWIVGERTQRAALPFVPVVELSFASAAWIDSLVVGGGSGWEMRAKLNLDAILAKRTGNVSPETKMAQVVDVLHGCNHTITIPVDDAEGDVVRCRWADSSHGECGGVCQALPGAVLNQRDCTLFYSAVGTAGLYVVAIQIEDFSSATDTTPFSSVPFQFVVNVYESSFDNASCYSKPTFSWPTRRDGACVGIPFNSTFHESIISENNGLEIQSIAVQSPSGMRKSGLDMIPGTDKWYVNITWTPLMSQVGNNILCFTAVDIRGTNSDRNCITLAVGTHPPVAKSGSMFPTVELLASNNQWRFEFDRPFVRPKRSAYIRYYDDTDTEIFKIDTSANPNVTFPTLPTDFNLTFTTTYIFKEKATYYIVLDNGITYGTEACGPESVGVFNPYFWRFTIKDDTPPVLNFLPHEMYSGGNIDIRWTFDEPATSTCLIQGPASIFSATCNDSLSLHNLTEGDFTLFVQASNFNGKAKQYQTSWYVDLKPPVVTITSNPPLVTNESSATFTMACTDRSPCQLWCADHPLNGQPTFVNCSSTHTASNSVGDGVKVFTVFGEDVVGNTGRRVTYTWTVDTVAPTVSPLPDRTVACGSPYVPSKIGIPSASDNNDPSPSATHRDTPGTGCRTIRTWTVTDRAGNTANTTQVISFTNVIAPSVRGDDELFVPCGETDRLSSSDYVVKALNITSPCGRKITVNYTDSIPVTDCGITVTRQWNIMDDCNSVTHFAQTIHVLFPTLPDFPANGQMHMSMTPRLGWPTYPQSQGYNVYVWQYDTSEQTTPTAFMPIWRRTYTVTDALSPNTKFLWRIGYIVPSSNGTREIPSPTWGFQTESYADLSLTRVQVPPKAFSGSYFAVTWVVENVGNVSTSQSTLHYNDAIYLSRSSEFHDARLAVRSPQRRYVDPQDGYTFSDDVKLQPSDVGTFYVFVVVDVHKDITDYSDANNRRLADQPVQVRLTPPPNLQVKSADTVPSSPLSGKQLVVRITVENSGDGITQPARWHDRLSLSVDDRRSDDDRILATTVHSGALASSQRYTSPVVVTIPNAVHGDYYIIASTDVYEEVFEHTDENDNDFVLKIYIVLSGFPNLVVSNVTVPNNVSTGDTLDVRAVIRNIGTAEPFEHSWKDGLKIASVTDGVEIYSATNQYVPGKMPFAHDSTYVSLFKYKVSPSARTGEYNVTVSPDVLNEVFEYIHDDDNQETVLIRINQVLPDLTLGPSTAVVFENGTGNYVIFNISVHNKGPGRPQVPSWENLIVLSSLQTTVQLTSFLLSNIFHQDQVLFSNQTTYVSTSLVGTFNVYASIDSRNQILEVNESNNYLPVAQVTFRERVPDLAVKSIDATDSTKSGSTMEIKWTVENIGNLASRRELSWSDEITLSAESGTKIFLARVFISLTDDLEPQKSYEEQQNVTIPINIAGQYKLGVTTALYSNRKIGAELNQGNNYMERSITISTPPSPDLQPTSCSYEIRLEFGTRLLIVVCTVTNVGNSMDKPMHWTDRISLVNSDGSAILSTDVSGVRKLSFGDTYSSIATLILNPTIDGYFRIEIQVDSSHDVAEFGGEKNNKLQESTVVIIPPGPSPRLSVVIEPVKQVTFQSGETLSVNCSVTNNGQSDLPLSTWTDALFLFSVPTATRQQVILSGFLISSVINNYQLKIGASYSGVFHGVLPHSVVGSLYVYVVTDINNRLLIRTEAGDKPAHLNTSIDLQPGPLPDLVISSTGNSSAIRVQSGQIYELVFTVTNIGNASANKMWYDSVYLSQEKLIDPFDIALKTAVRPRALGRGESYTQKLSFVIPFDLPTVTYYFIITANVRRDVFESSFDNNNQYQLVDIAVLPAVDLVVMNVTSSTSNATYSENVDFQWSVANNGSLAARGYKCDSVYLSADDMWQISDVTVVEPRCGPFRLDRKGSSSDSSRYSSTGRIPPVAKGSYKTIVRTRSNVRDYNLINNIGVSVQNMSVNPPTIGLGENKTYDFVTNEDMTFELTNIPVGIGLIVRLNTLYELAYHGLFIKRNSPPSSNDYDVAYKQIGTTRQTVYVQYTKTGDYYLLVESASGMFRESYQVSISVREAKFEVSGVYPSVMAKDVTATVIISGTLFGRKLRAFLTSDTEMITEATRIYRYTSEETYATFSSYRLSNGTYAVLLQDVGRNQSFELKNAMTVSGLATVGKLQVNILPPRALRPGESGVVSVKIDNAGYSDVPMPLLLLRADHSIKLLLTQSDVGVLPTKNALFFPLLKNHPPTVILPKSTAVFSFHAVPDEADFIGDVTMSLYLASDELVLTILSQLKVDLKPSNIAGDVWDIAWRNVEQCFGNSPTSLLRTINGRLTQHYDTATPVNYLISHVVGVADGALPHLILSESVDIKDRTYLSALILGITRIYPHQLTVRNTAGLFGKGWTSPVLEMTVTISANSVRLVKQRQEFTFVSDDNSRLFFSHRLPNDRIRTDKSAVIYTTRGVSYIFNKTSGLLNQIAVEAKLAEAEFISVTRNVNGMPITLTHRSSGNMISITYGNNGFISSAALLQKDAVISQVYYTYNDDDYLVRETGERVTEYEYTTDGDLRLITQDQRRTEITYDEMRLMKRTVYYLRDAVLQELEFNRYCDGSIRSTVSPQNLSSTFLFGLRGELIENIDDDYSLPVSVRRDNVRDKIYVSVGDELKQTRLFDRSSLRYVVVNANDEKLSAKLAPDGKLVSIGDALSAYYNFTYSGDLVSAVSFRDGTQQSFMYNDKGQCTSATLQDESQITYSYDENQYVRVVETTSGRYIYSYDSKGLLTAVSTPGGDTTTLAYDSQRLPVSVRYGDDIILIYTYNECGRRSSITSNTGYNCSYVYDSFCRLSKVLEGSGSVVASYKYGQDSRIAKKQLSNGMYTEYTYENGTLRLLQLRNYFPNGTLASYYSYSYNERGHRVETHTLSHTHEGIWKYRYDALGQLIEWRSPFRDTYENIEYSSNLNRKSKQTATGKSFYATNSLYQYTQYGKSENFTYDLNGNLVRKSKHVGTRVSIEEFAYDQLGHCTNMTVNQLTCRYQYNIFGAVSNKRCSNGRHTEYLIDPFGTYGASILAERSASGQKMIYYGQEHGLIAQIDADDPSAAMFYIFDGDGSTIQTSGRTGEIVTNYDYDPFGRLVFNSVDSDNAFRYLGKYGIATATETASIVHIRHRLYDSEHGRFISPHPTGMLGCPTNPYSYATNNPLTFKDTNGLFVIFLAPMTTFVGRSLLYDIAEGPATEGMKPAANYPYEVLLSEYKFDLRDFAEATGKAALYGAIASANLYRCRERNRLASSCLGTLLKRGKSSWDGFDLKSKEFRPAYSKFLRAITEPLTGAHHLISRFMRWVRSIDPNEITGPVGYGDANYISADQNLIYKIEFENNPNATAPAQKVKIRCPIDPNLELGTFKVGLVKFDTHEKDFGFESAHPPISNVDATEKTGTFVHIHAYADAEKREAVWELQSINPATGYAPTDPLVGFLPPNNGTNGQGYVTFGINVKRSIQSLTKITENATIVFDENPHLDTSTIFHTVDRTPGTVVVNVSTLFGGVVFNLVTGDVGSGVKSVDLYLVIDGSAKLIKSDINQSVVIVELTENVLHTIIGVATDYVGNTGRLNLWDSVGVYVPVDCPANCSGRGRCGAGGLCVCEPGYGGNNCSLNVSVSCEPPILEVSHSDSVQNTSLLVFIRARSSQEPAFSVAVVIMCRPNDTAISKGRVLADGVYLNETDFGNVLFTAPDWFHGLLLCRIQAVVVDVCGTSVRLALLAANVVASTGQTTVKTDAVSSTARGHGTTPTIWPDVTGSVMTSVTSVTGSSWHSSSESTVSTRTGAPPPGGHTSDNTLSTSDVFVSKVAVTQMSTITPVTSVTGSSWQSSSISGRTVKTQTGTPPPGGQTSSDKTLFTSDVFVSKVAVTRMSTITPVTSLIGSFLQSSSVSGRTLSTGTGTPPPRGQTSSDKTLSTSDVFVSKVAGTQMSTITPVTSLTGSSSQSSSGRTITRTGAPPPGGQTSDKTLSTSDVFVSKVAGTQMSTITPVTSLTGSSSQSSSGRTITPTGAPPPGGHTSDKTLSTSDVTLTTTSEVAVTQVPGDSEWTTSATTWGTWSNWSSCSRSCDIGVQSRSRQCLLPPPADCGSDNTDRRFCQLSTCPGTQAECKAQHFVFCFHISTNGFPYSITQPQLRLE